ncbi:glycoprotein precursor [Orthonairovirus qalyubense]|uniref:glycoprotein precursor n=1 Tax=Orthonairovirus qalyubense TaxID=3052532 RepID=UPI001E259B23|nr:glycoprotein precursor [Orthonairovirus qalyubense]
MRTKNGARHYNPYGLYCIIALVFVGACGANQRKDQKEIPGGRGKNTMETVEPFQEQGKAAEWYFETLRDDEDLANNIRRKRDSIGNSTSASEGSGEEPRATTPGEGADSSTKPTDNESRSQGPGTESVIKPSEQPTSSTQISQVTPLLPSTTVPLPTAPTKPEQAMAASREDERQEQGEANSSPAGKPQGLQNSNRQAEPSSTTGRKLLSINESETVTRSSSALGFSAELVNALSSVGKGMMVDIRTGMSAFKLGMAFQEKKTWTERKVRDLLGSLFTTAIKAPTKAQEKREVRDVIETSGGGDTDFKVLRLRTGKGDSDDALYSVSNIYFPMFSRQYEINIDDFDTVLQPVHKGNFSAHGAYVFCQTEADPAYMEQGIFGNWSTHHCWLGDKCNGPAQEIEIQDLNFENIKVVSSSDMPVLIIDYLTAQLGYNYNDLRMHVTWGDCLLLLPFNPVACFSPIRGSTLYPVEHFVIEKKWILPNSSLTLCGVKRQSQTSMKGVWTVEKKLVKINFGSENPRHGRKLLSIGERKRKDWCVSGGMLSKHYRYRLSTDNYSIPGPYVGFCNESKITNLPLGPEQGCYSVGKMQVHYQCTPRSSAFQAKPQCNITSTEHCGKDRICINVRLNGQGHISYSTESGEKGVEFCSPECGFSIRKEMFNDVVLTCPSGKQHRLTINAVDFDCPMKDWLGEKSLYICRMTHRPKLFYTVLLWSFFGYIATRMLIGCLWRTLLFLCKLTSCLKGKLDRGRGYCECCKEWVNSSEEWQRHDLCLVNKCPYCIKRVSSQDLKKHVSKDCLEREKVLENDKTVLLARRTPRFILKISAFLNECSVSASRLSWSITLLVLILLLIRPVTSFKTVDPVKGIWEDEMLEVEYCDKSCIQLDDGCVCEVQEQKRDAFSMRKPLSLHSDQDKRAYAKELTKTRKIMKSIDVEAPWGTIHVPEAYSPPRSMKHISLSWESNQHVGDKIIVSGKSTSVMKLEPKSSISWLMTDVDAAEEKILTVSLLDYTQVYASRLEYISGDRKVSLWSKGSCTGNCPSKCGCNRKTCQTQEWYHVRNWRCNPSWCWGVGTGCNCCAADVTELYDNWLVSVWNTEHQRTPVIACVEFDHENRVCEAIEAGVEMNLGPVTVSFSDPFGEEKKLANRIALFHKIPGTTSHIDLLHNYGVTSAREMCSVQSCTHGSAGDYQIFSPDVLVMDDVTSTNFFKKYKNTSSIWMAWEGVSMSYYCNPGDWSTCVGQNLVERNAEAFQNIYNLESNYSSSFFFHSTRVRGLEDTLSLDLKGRPLSSGGDLNVFVTVQGLELHSKKVVLEGLRIKLTDCTGCYACTEGGTCSLSLSIKEPQEFTLHLVSETKGVVIPDTSFIVKADADTTSKIRIFSVLKDTEICVSLLESNLCTSCSKEQTRSCVKAALEPPEAIVLEHRGTLFAKSNQTCGASALSCWASSVSGFGKGLSSLFTGIFGSVLKGLLATIVPGVIIFLLVMYGNRLSFVLSLCKRGRAIVKRPTGHQKLNDFSSILNDETLSEKEKEFMKLISGKVK